MAKIENMRNIAIIAHVDHGKTTIVDSMLKQAGIYRENEQIVEQVMDSNDLERERGITILAKNTAIQYKDIRINVVDTPGHADFGGEVERVLKMVDAVLLVVDAFDGPMPQTRFVLRKALEMGLKPIVCINKIDRPDARPNQVVDMVLDLFIELGADDDQLEFPIVYSSGKTGVATLDLKEFEEGKELDFTPLLDTVVKYTPCPEGEPDEPLQLLVSNIDSDPYIGRIAIGRIERGTITQNQNVAVVTYGEEGKRSARIVKLLRFAGLSRQEIDSASIGEIVCVAGIPDINIGDTICDAQTPE
ncbi:MAG: GTP-binding protein, partial [Clostridiales bacterium]|nr:GTP-binding protein [Clostridiales bacterium]